MAEYKYNSVYCSIFFMFKASLETLSVTWNYTDPDSDISQINLGIYEAKAGRTRKIYPSE